MTEDRTFIDILEGQMDEDSSGGGYVGLAHFSLGYKAFLPGYSNEDSWWPYTAGNDGEMAEAEVKCKVAINESGVTGKRPQRSLGFILFKDSIKGRAITWKEDRHFTYPMWTDAAKQIIFPAVRELGIAPGDFWARWAWKEDPSGRIEEDQDGNERVALIAYPAEVYGSEAEAEAAGGPTEVAPAPDWLKDMVEGIKADVSSGMAATALAAKHSVESQVAENLLSDDKVVVAAAIAGMTSENVVVIGNLL